MAIGTAPCEWPVLLCDTTDECGGCSHLGSLTEERRELVFDVAREYLWRWSGRRFGLCSETIRPCRQGCVPDASGAGLFPWVAPHPSPWLPVLRDGQWYNLACGGGCRDACGCDSVCEVVLPGAVHDVTEVRVDGVPLLDVEYRVDNHRRLVRVPWERRSSTDPEGPTGGAPRWTWVEHGIWAAFGEGWGPGPDLPTSTGGDRYVQQWPTNAAGVRGQYLRLHVPGGVVVSIFGPERGVTLRKTDDPGANGSHDDAAGVYRGGGTTTDGTEYVIRFDGDQLVELDADGPGAQVREVGFLSPGGGECWPSCQNLSAPSNVAPDRVDLAAGTWEVTYRRGVEVPKGGQVAAGLLACEMAKAMCGDSSCALPTRVQTITRQGVTMALLDEAAGVDGRTGIWMVDAWLTSVNEPHKRMGSGVYSPDRPRHRRST